MKQVFLSILLMFLPIVASAQDAMEIDGIYYNLITKGKVAEVTKNPSNYSGNVVLPESVTYDDVDYSVTSIGKEAFFGCSGLTSITIPGSVTFIGESVFYDCSGLSSITIPGSITSIGNSAFSHCSGLTSITIPNSVTSIGSSAFSHCSGLTSITIPNSVTSIGNYAFSDCTSLTSITIPNSVTSIGDWTFQNCSGLTSVIISSSVTSIGYYTFYGCSDLTSVTIPNSVTSIDKYAFYGCSGLTSLTIPNSVVSIGNNAFSGCCGLNSITIPNSVTSIGGSAFWDCSGLTSVTIGSGIQRIGSWAFESCPELTDVYCYAENVPNTNSNAFEGSYIEHATLHVRAASIEAYKSTGPWSGFKEVVAIGESTPEYPKFIYEIGNESGWMTPHALCKIDDRNAYRGYYYLDGEFKFKPQEDMNDWNGDWEYDGEAIGATGKITPNGHANCPSVEPGFYQILVDLDEMTYIVSRIETIGICGSFTGWSADVDMTYDVKNNVWLADRVVFDQDDNDFKFRANHAWDLNWGGADDNLVFYGTELHLAAGSYDFALSLSYEGNNKVSIIPSSQKCATPTIIYENGKVKFACETLGVSFKYKIEIEDATENEGDEVSLTGIYKVTVYATKAGCKDSDVATKEINISGTRSGDLNSDGVINAADIVTITNIIMGE